MVEQAGTCEVVGSLDREVPCPRLTAPQVGLILVFRQLEVWAAAGF